MQALPEHLLTTCFVGAVGVLWFVPWLVVGYSTPSSHPRISRKERAYIEDSIVADRVVKEDVCTTKVLFK